MAHVRPNFTGERLSEDETALIEAVLENYAHLTGDQLEEMTHNEDPWRAARGNLPPQARCENIISDDLMARYYGARL